MTGKRPGIAAAADGSGSVKRPRGGGQPPVAESDMESLPSSAGAMHVEAMREAWVRQLASSGKSMENIKKELEDHPGKGLALADAHITKAPVPTINVCMAWRMQH